MDAFGKLGTSEYNDMSNNFSAVIGELFGS